ncbi:unnamed protein product [Brugia pahangi]|uniref:PPIase cyclophilin-type domain-containing protein n=1 Tax=Brugia pahangi TaxID=6280 RepID=A0A0N4TGV6_BRUPA|nr:unnamed protein product [Brugia pahangi]
MTWQYRSLLLLCLLNVYATLKSDNEPKGPKVTDKVILTIKIGDEEAGIITIGLFGKTVPKTVKNFIQLSKKAEGVSTYYNIISFENNDFRNCSTNSS